MKLEKYKKNYISNFIISIDLENNLVESEYENILEMLSKNYPIKEKVDSLINKNILYNIKRTERITINNNSILYESLNYASFSKIKPILEKIFLFLKNNCEIKSFNRISLRYINLIRKNFKEKEDIFDWKGYINSQLLFETDLINTQNILQQIQTIEFKLDYETDLLCRLQFGIPNRNMPADLMEKVFLIDIDGFTNSTVEQPDVMNILDIIHQKNTLIFEKCIDDKLRREMNE